MSVLAKMQEFITFRCLFHGKTFVTEQTLYRRKPNYQITKLERRKIYRRQFWMHQFRYSFGIHYAYVFLCEGCGGEV